MRLRCQHTDCIAKGPALAASLSLALLACAGACCLAGCKVSLAVTNIEHDQNASETDQDSGKTQQVVSEQGAITDEDTGLYTTDVSKNDATMKLNVTYTSADAETKLPVAKFKYDKNSKDNSEASEGVREQTKDDPEKPQQEEQEQKKQNGQNKGKKAKSGQSKKKGKGSGGSGKDKNSKDKGAGKEGKATVYDTTGDKPNIPDVSTVAATGQTAVIAQMLGGSDGKTPLVAADAELLKSKFSEVFDDEGSASVAKAWSDDGSETNDLDINALVKAKPDTVLVTSEAQLSKKQQSRLANAKISITVVPSLRSATSIKVAVSTIGKMLSKATDGKAEERAESYISYHDNLTAEIEGDRGYGAYKKEKTYYLDADAQKRSKMFATSLFTLVIDQWDTKASYNFNDAITTASAGIGLSKVGYRSTPTSYYLGVAGVVNNAAVIDHCSLGTDGQLICAWQFSASTLDPAKIKYSGAVKGTYYSNFGSGFSKTTLTKVDSGKNTYASNGFGTSKFPAVIVASQSMKESFKKSAASSKGVYHAFGEVKSGTGSFQGTTSGKTEIYSSINEDVDLDQAILVNPHGLFSDWLSGSVESCLESAWAANVNAFDAGWNCSAEEEIKSFYKTFYRYDLSNAQVKSILEGED